ncbi:MULTISPECIES: hypothetical protein [unclassified Microbacterium]|uniref:hypothetical protein n=1 Tax=unclassified Microbacterium TaxID=2609290 RepID=UPI001604FB03|nr:MULTISPECIES: hypothetical protein [unclassified Microbacterium]QNA93603.1 hypothetical protein G4G29_17195 [Microbacterium sp. Se63.02b]QYM63863.1 hypothetical protein K1X59_17265 [Microbacterium sp. Se5.02b]
MTQPQGALLVGSVNYDDAETTIRTAAKMLGDRLRRIPDGEVGKRFHWIMFQPDVIGRAEGIERVGAEPIPFPAGIDARGLRIGEGVEAASIQLPSLGYASAAIESYAVFTRLRAEGAVPADVRFQVSLPTPLAVISSFFRGDDRAAIEPGYTAAILRELDAILAAVPHDDLAVQWDVASEMGIIERAAGYGAVMEAWWPGDPFDGLVSRLAALVDAVPGDVEVGVHLCYGDAGEKHFFEPTDAANLVRYANAVMAASGRPLTWLHLPVPIERDDEGYFAPLADLAPVDELYLGLVHREDGPEGAQRRIAAAAPFTTAFGVATECGIGRAPAGSTESILRTHAEVASAW